MTKEDLGQEIADWMCFDPGYCKMLVLLAFQEGLISLEEKEYVQEDLELFWGSLKEIKGDFRPCKIPKKYLVDHQRRYNVSERD